MASHPVYRFYAELDEYMPKIWGYSPVTDDMNFLVKKIPRIYKQCYGDRLASMQKSINLMEREYLRKKP